jgi:hypothetical protein
MKTLWQQLLRIFTGSEIYCILYEEICEELSAPAAFGHLFTWVLLTFRIFFLYLLQWRFPDPLSQR